MAQDAATESLTMAKASTLRLLILTPQADSKTTPSPFPDFLQRLTGSRPSQDVEIFAGYTSHPQLDLETKYYNTSIGIWCDELPEQTDVPLSHNLKQIDVGSDLGRNDNANTSKSATSGLPTDVQPVLSEWQDQMLSTSAKEVRDVIGGIILLLPFTQQALLSENQKSDQISTWLSYIEPVTALRDAIEDESGRDVASIIALQDTTPVSALSGTSDTKYTKQTQMLLETLEDTCLSQNGIIGWDHVLWKFSTTDKAVAGELQINPKGPQAQARNEYGEKTGFPRILEVLEGIYWTADAPSFDGEGEGEGDVDDQIGTDPLSFLDDIPDSNNNSTTADTDKLSFLDDIPDSNNNSTTADTDKLSYARINQGTEPQIQLLSNSRSPSKPTVSTESESLLAREQHEFQREMLGLKMAMLDVDDPDSAPSSLAGEFDISDFGARTPLPAKQLPSGSRLKASTVMDNDDNNGGEDIEVEKRSLEPDDEEVQVDQLTGLMERVVAMREAAEGMSGPEKERFARREVNRLMKELG